MSAEQRTYEYWLGSREVKYSASGVERGARPGATIRRARRVLEAIGVTKVTDVTDLDKVGIPNFMTVRPHDLGPGLSYYNGKGRTRADAHAGALMEAVERHAGERYDGAVTQMSYRDLRGEHPCVDPLAIPAPSAGHYDESRLVEWVAGFDLLNQCATYVPLNCVVAPYEPAFTCAHLFYSSTNGLASGNTRLEALCHALCEVVERDALALALARSHVRPAVGAILSELGFGGGISAESVDAPSISLRGLPRPSAALVRKLQGAGLEVRLWHLTSNTGIPTIGCTIVDPQAPPTVVNEHSGCGTHPDARVALSRALTEAAQTRIGFIQGGREDVPEIAGDREARPAESWLAPGPEIAFDEIDSREFSTINEDVELMLERMRRAGFEQVVVVDITRDGIDIPVVRVVVPGAESWTLFFQHTGRAGIGRRLLHEIHQGSGELTGANSSHRPRLVAGSAPLRWRSSC